MLEQHEFIMSIQSGIRGLCRITKREIPSAEMILRYAKHKFISLDKDLSNYLDLSEITYYMATNSELGDFLHRYCEV